MVSRYSVNVYLCAGLDLVQPFISESAHFLSHGGHLRLIKRYRIIILQNHLAHFITDALAIGTILLIEAWIACIIYWCS